MKACTLYQIDSLPGWSPTRTASRPGKVHVDVRVRDGEPETVKIRDDAVVVFGTTLSVPASADAPR